MPLGSVTTEEAPMNILVTVTTVTTFNVNKLISLNSRYRDAPSEQNIFFLKPDTDFFSVVCPRFSFISPFLSFLRKFDSAATEMPHCEENIFFQKRDPDFLLVISLVC